MGFLARKRADSGVGIALVVVPAGGFGGRYGVEGGIFARC